MNIVVVFGGKSVEHEISIISAFQVIKTLEIKYNVIPIYISKDNEFYYDKKMKDISYFNSTNKILKKKNIVSFHTKDSKYYIKGKKKVYFDLIFPIVHGKGCEDGSLLDYFKFQGFPIVGNNASFYSIAQNKALTKRVLDGLNIDNVEYKLLKRGEDYNFKDFDYPCIVKPNNLGSSLGITIATNFVELEKAISFCFKIDTEVIVEKYLENSKEYNVAVLNNKGIIETSKVDTVLKNKMFTFEDKYLQGNKKKGMANNREYKKEKINKDIEKEIKRVSKIIYKELGASGVIRIDFLYKDKLYVNEINSIPGSYAYYLWDNKYDFLELLDIVVEEAKRDNYFFFRKNELIDKNVIFKIS